MVLIAVLSARSIGKSFQTPLATPLPGKISMLLFPCFVFHVKSCYDIQFFALSTCSLLCLKCQCNKLPSKVSM